MATNSYVYVENVISEVSATESALPAPEKMPRKQFQRMAALQTRAHLVYEDEKTKRQPLTDDERQELDVLEERWRDDFRPHFGKELMFPFAAPGKPGSVWRALANEATVLLAQHPTRLRIRQKNDPPSIPALEHDWRPSIAESTPCSTTDEASKAATLVRLNGNGEVEMDYGR